MRGLMGLLVLGAIGAGVLVFMQREVVRDPDPTILVALGEPQRDQVEVNICIPLLIRKAEVPPEGGRTARTRPHGVGAAPPGV